MYIVTATDSGGCTSRDTVIVNVELNCGEIFIPSAFSPNNDQSNDVLYVRGRCIQSLDFAVYDRWGEKVFSTTSQDVGWDGKLRGQNMDNGVFVYYLSAYLKDGTVIKKQGSVNLIR